ncbi:hypothetical protein M408DRAFT_24626 [Serendipita vermifera MAFF 305830]|uniref:Uncharacterized protein n=1 Tax=Serendipita vermifera MAFF 305830 TaxID=933852 RepID=A0A0C2XE77_SERVB|nr:hypothetical protein M408DRAFT_24626 [Serendipita vermifera MAFF 305830]
MVYWKPVTVVGGLLGLLSSAFASPTNTTSSQTTSTWSQTTSTSLETVSTVSISTAPSLTATPIPSALTLKVNTNSGVRNKTAPLLHGIFFEELNVSASARFI